MLESFISTQKLSVQKALARKFRRFMTAKADFDQLALFKLQASALRHACHAMHAVHAVRTLRAC